MKKALILAAGVLASRLAIADLITMKDGRVIEGDVIEQDDQHVKVKVKYGAVVLDRDKIASIEEKPTPEQEYAERVKKLDVKNVNQQLDLAEWAESKKLEAEAIEHFLAAFQLDPESQRANEAMKRRDWHLVAGEWQDPDTYYPSKGWVRYEGRWTHPLEYGWRLSQQIRQKLEEKAKGAHGKVSRAKSARQRAEAAGDAARRTADARREAKAAAERELPDAEADVRSLGRVRDDAARAADRAQWVYDQERLRYQRGETNALGMADYDLRQARKALASAEFDLSQAERRRTDLDKIVSSADASIEAAEKAEARAAEDAKAAADEEAEAAGAAQQADEELETALGEEERAKLAWEKVKPPK